MRDDGAARWRWAAIGMGAGALYDLAFAAAILFFGRSAARLMGIGYPDDPVHLGLAGILLVLLAGLYLLPAVDPRRYRGVVAVAAAGRMLGFAYLLQAWYGGRPPAYLWLALGDLAFSLLHAGSLWYARERRPPETASYSRDVT
jgi:hypothetical protein